MINRRRAIMQQKSIVLKLLNQYSGLVTDPSGIGIDNSNRLVYVVEKTSSDLIKFDADTLTEIDRISAVVTATYGNTLLVDEANQKLYVPNSSVASVVEVDLTTFTITTTRTYNQIALALNCALDGVGKFYISDLNPFYTVQQYADPTDTTSDALITLATIGFQMIYNSSDGFMYIASPAPDEGIRKLNLTTLAHIEILSPTNGLRQPRGVLVDPSKNLLLTMYSNEGSIVNKVLAYNLSSLELIQELEVNGVGQLRNMAHYPSENKYFCVNFTDNEIIEMQHRNPDLTPRLFFLAGQSNSLGTMAITSAEAPAYFGKMENINGHNAYIWSVANQQWEILEYGVNQQSYDSDSFGQEMELAYRAILKYNTDIYLIKYAESGTGIYQDGAERDWNINSTNELYDEFVTECTTAIAAMPVSYKVESLFWMQGERDATDTTKANAYETNLRALIQQFKLDVENCKFIVGRLKSSFYPFETTVRTKQQNVCSLTTNPSRENTCYLINLDDLAKFGDNIHYTGASQITIANRMLEYESNYI